MLEVLDLLKSGISIFIINNTEETDFNIGTIWLKGGKDHFLDLDYRIIIGAITKMHTSSFVRAGARYPPLTGLVKIKKEYFRLVELSPVVLEAESLTFSLISIPKSSSG